ncbi:armadillo-type protein [Mycena latifolia]|nr:armadillo-type protein [Mycena latifolia]
MKAVGACAHHSSHQGCTHYTSMPPPPRPESLHSWWSDSNPPGATIPLHTLAKPLSKFLHRRQLSGIISKGRGQPISKENVDILACYLEAKEIPTSTELEILEDLEARAKWEAQAKTMAQEYPLATLIRLLHSPETTIVESVCSLLGSLAMWKSVNAKVILLNTCSYLIPLAIPFNGVSLKQSIYALSCISIWETGARALAEANIHQLATLLEFDDPDILKWTCRILGEVARSGCVIIHPESTAYIRLESLLEHPSTPVQQEALYALRCVDDATEQTEDSSTGTSVETPFHLHHNLWAQSRRMTDSIRSAISWVEKNDQTMASRRADLPFLSALNSGDIDLVKGAMAELEHISNSEPGAILVNYHLEPFVELLGHGDLGILESTCRILANLARIARVAIHKLSPYHKLTLLLRHPEISLKHLALHSLHQIYYHDAEFSITSMLAKLLRRPSLFVLQPCCKMLESQAQNMSLHGSIVDSGVCVSLVSNFFLHHDTEDRISALSVCVGLSKSEVGGRALVNADLLRQVPRMLDHPDLKEPVCYILGNIARWPSLHEAVRQLDLCNTLNLIQSRAPDRSSLHEAAAYALRMIVGASASGPSLTAIEEEGESESV